MTINPELYRFIIIYYIIFYDIIKSNKSDLIIAAIRDFKENRFRIYNIREGEGRLPI